MLQTLFHIPNEIAGIPTFGLGWLLGLWVVFSVVLLIRLNRQKAPSAEIWGHVPLLLLVGAAIWFLLPKLCEPEGFPIRGFGVSLLVAVSSAVGLAVWRARRLGLDPELIFTLAFWAFVPGIIGARAFYVIEYWHRLFLKETVGETLVAIVNVTSGGIVVYGSVIGGALGLAAFIWKYKMPPLATLDLVAPSFLLGLAIGRIGCIFNGCCFGGVCGLTWAITFPAGSPSHVHQVRHGETFLHGLKIVGELDAEPVITDVQPGSPADQQGLRPGQRIASINGLPVSTVEKAQWALIRAHKTQAHVSVGIANDPRLRQWPIEEAPHSESVHPTQVYALINSLLLCLFLLAYAPFSRRDGQVWALFLTLYPVTRFLLEMIRDDEPKTPLTIWQDVSLIQTPLTISQKVSLILLLLAAAFWARVLTKPPGTTFPSYGESAPAG